MLFHKIFSIVVGHSGLPISLSFKGKNSVWANPDTSIHSRSEMYTKERKPWIWNLLQVSKHILHYFYAGKYFRQKLFTRK